MEYDKDSGKKIFDYSYYKVNKPRRIVIKGKLTTPANSQGGDDEEKALDKTQDTMV